jgi:hypothetical protein
LVFALVAAAGTDLSSIKTQLKAQLASFEYEYAEIKLSQLIAGLCKIDTAGKAEDERILALMDGGDRIRAAATSGDGVTCLAVTAIRTLRTELEAKRKASPGAIAFVLDSLKNPDEIDTLRSAYGNNVYVISVYSKEKDREARLASKIASSCTSTVRKDHRTRARRIAPPFYQRAFAFRPRKGRTGEIVELKRETAIPIGASFVVSNPQIEENLSSKVDEIRTKIHGESPTKKGARNGRA